MRRASLITLIALLALTAAPRTTVPAHAADDAADFAIEVFPHADPDVGFTNTWGADRSGGRRHRGTDIISAKLTPVVAVADGFVEIMRTDSWLSGNYVMLRHAGDWTSWYLHLNNDTPGTDDGATPPEFTFAADLAEGDYVAAGQLIGFVGDSGNAEGSVAHTHFELRRDGRQVNPYPYLVGAWDRQLRFWEMTNALRMVSLY
jgi:murein DD-endopeptidase MepM/ murein hydrolase activator NlpD